METFGKGNLVVGQSGGPTPVINASLAGILQEAQKHQKFQEIYGMVHGIEGLLNENLIDLRRESPETIGMLVDTPSSILGSCRHKLSDEDYALILKVLKAHNVHFFLYIGGNDSMDTCHRIANLAESESYELHVAGVPKTIDNDLILTDHTPGYGSAAKFIAFATRDAGLDLEAMATFDDVTILETMGRNTGWLAASSSLAKEREDDAPHLIYFPEIPIEEASLLEDVARVHKRWGRVFVVVCEGIKDEAGSFIGEHAIKANSKDAFGHTLVALTSGVAAYLSNLIRTELGLQSRFLRPALIGRDFSPCISTIDRQEALEVGRHAATSLAMGESDFMVSLERISEAPYSFGTRRVPLVDVANKEKELPREFMNDEGNMTTERFRSYALPLIDGPLPPISRLRGIRVPQKVFTNRPG